LELSSFLPWLLISSQIKKLRSELAHVILQSEAQAQEVKNLLDQAVKQTLSDEMKAHISARVASEVKERVTHQVRYPLHLNIFTNRFLHS
jgi:3-deoxy-D-manno-octulosonic-acid transferase